jgi:riboflavin kinase/FMN adenylyltransferase
MVSEARGLGAIPTLFTFNKHPLSVLAPSKSPLIITPFKKKMSLLKKLGVDWVICIPFTRQFANIGAEEFIERVLHKTLGVKKIFTGPTYFFGRNRQGSPEMLKARADQFDYSVQIMHAVNVEGAISSSTNIRQKILCGEVDQAQALLGRPYSIHGRVVHGTQKAKALGIDTATLRTRSKLIPPDGVYAVNAEVSGTTYLALANIGHQPTFGPNERAIEIHILEFNRDIYGEPMEISFLKRIRPEKRFESVDALRRQIDEDIRLVSTEH